VWNLLNDTKRLERLIGPCCVGWDETKGTFKSRPWSDMSIGKPVVMQLEPGAPDRVKVIDVEMPDSDDLTTGEIDLPPAS